MPERLRSFVVLGLVLAFVEEQQLPSKRQFIKAQLIFFVGRDLAISVDESVHRPFDISEITLIACVLPNSNESRKQNAFVVSPIAKILVTSRDLAVGRASNCRIRHALGPGVILRIHGGWAPEEKNNTGETNGPERIHQDEVTALEILAVPPGCRAMEVQSVPQAFDFRVLPVVSTVARI